MLSQVLGLSVALGLCPVAAHARVSVQVPDGCGSQQELEDGLRQLVGAVAQEAPGAAQLEITAHGPADLFELKLDLDGDRRILRDRQCQTLFRSALVMIAATFGEPGASATRAAHDRTHDDPERWHATAAVGGGAVLGVVPEVGARIELSASLERRPFGMQLALHGVLPRDTTGARMQPGATVSAYGVRGAALLIPWRVLRIAVAAELGYLHASGTRVRNGESGGALSLSAQLEAALRVLHFGPGHVDLALFGQWALVRPQFEVADFGAVYRLPRFGGGAIARVGVTIF